MDIAYGYEAIGNCQGGKESHIAHLDFNGECPRYGALTELLKLSKRGA